FWTAAPAVISDADWLHLLSSLAGWCWRRLAALSNCFSYPSHEHLPRLVYTKQIGLFYTEHNAHFKGRKVLFKVLKPAISSHACSLTGHIQTSSRLSISFRTFFTASMNWLDSTAKSSIFRLAVSRFPCSIS